MIRTGALVVSDDTLLNKAMVKRMVARPEFKLHVAESVTPAAAELCRRMCHRLHL